MNHVTGAAKSGVAAVDNRATYAKEEREALAQVGGVADGDRGEPEEGRGGRITA